MRLIPLMAIASLGFLPGCEQLSDFDGGGGGGETHEIVYRVEGRTTASITYENENQDTSQETGASLPWNYSFQSEEFAFAYVSAQNDGGGTITCMIEIDGQVAESNDSSGDYAICTASGSV
jgi:hypothetical protein